jgi:ubiquinone/menaquinone biosynthesis C-methylase UbiE
MVVEKQGSPVIMRRMLLLLLAALTACPSAETPQRTPANVVAPSSADWLERSSRENEERPEIVIAAMKLQSGDIVADVGAGSGFYTRRLARAVGPDGVVYANDIQQEMLDALRENAARENIRNIVSILGSETDPKLPKATFDWVLLVDVYHEFQQPKPMLAAIRAALKPEGRVALVEYRETSTHISPLHRMSKEQVLREWEPAGFRLETIVEEMPMHRLYIFSRR